MTQLRSSRPPRLPNAPQQYDTQYQNQFSDVLRLYFNQLDNSITALLSPRGGQYVNSPYASISRTTDKTFTVNTATQITFDTNDFLNGCANDGTDGISVEQAGLYNYQFSVQFANTDSQARDAWIWLRKNGVNIAGTASQFSVPSKHGSVNGHLIAAANFFVQLGEGDTVEMYGAADSATVFLESYPAQTSPFAMPSIPSVVATLSFVSNVAP